MKKGIIAGCVVIVALGAVIVPKVLTKKTFAEAVADPIVEVTAPQRRDITLTTGLVGNVEPEDVIYVYPKASGDVTEVNIQAGDTVQAGQQLCIVDTRQIDSAKSSLDSARLALTQAQEELSRQAVLYSGGGISEQAYRQYQDGVKSAQINYDNAKVNYDNQVSYSRITAPISGVVEVCNIENYMQVGPGDMICVISGQGARIVSFSTTERIKNNLEAGDQIAVEKDGEKLAGTIYEISSMADSSTGLFKVKARLNGNADEKKLATGSAVKLYVISESVEKVLTVPVNSVYYDGGLAFVYTYDQTTGCLHKVQVEDGLYDADYIEIKSGLNGNEQVLTTWNSELYEGVSVRLKGSVAASEPQRQ